MNNFLFLQFLHYKFNPKDIGPSFSQQIFMDWWKMLKLWCELQLEDAEFSLLLKQWIELVMREASRW